MELKKLGLSDIHTEMLLHFRHHQHITEKWVKDQSAWKLLKVRELREWNEKKKRWIPEYMRLQAERGGSVICAFHSGEIIGFCCVDGILLGMERHYANLTMLFVDDHWQGRGIGTDLFKAACKQASLAGADKLFISAIPSGKTVAFYQKIGCTGAREIIPQFIDTPDDYYLEYDLRPAAEIKAPKP